MKIPVQGHRQLGEEFSNLRMPLYKAAAAAALRD